MKQKIEIIMAMVVIAAAVFATPKSAEMVMSTETEESPAVIVIDAGHGGSQLRKCCMRSAFIVIIKMG